MNFACFDPPEYFAGGGLQEQGGFNGSKHQGLGRAVVAPDHLQFRPRMYDRSLEYFDRDDRFFRSIVHILRD